MTYGYIPISQPRRSQRYAWRSVSATSSELRMRRAQDQIEKRRDAGGQRSGQHRLDVPVDLRLVEFAEHPLREALDAEAQHPKAGAPHGGQALRASSHRCGWC